MRARHDFF